MISASPAAKSPFGSLTLRSAAVAVIAYAASRLGVAAPDGAAQTLAEAAVDLLFAMSMIGVGVGRARASAPLK